MQNPEMLYQIVTGRRLVPCASARARLARSPRTHRLCEWLGWTLVDIGLRFAINSRGGAGRLSPIEAEAGSGGGPLLPSP